MVRGAARPIPCVPWQTTTFIWPLRSPATRVARRSPPSPTRRAETRVEPDENISLIVCGRRTVVTRSAELKRRTRVMILPVGIAGSGIRQTLDRVVRKDVASDLFIHFFLHDPTARPLEISGGRMSFGCLGKHRGPSDAVNMQRLLAAIEKFLPNVPIDRRMMEAGASNTDAVLYNRRSGAPPSTAIATLIHWQHIAEQSPRRHYTATESMADPRGRMENSGL